MSNGVLQPIQMNWLSILWGSYLHLLRTGSCRRNPWRVRKPLHAFSGRVCSPDCTFNRLKSAHNPQSCLIGPVLYGFGLLRTARNADGGECLACRCSLEVYEAFPRLLVVWMAYFGLAKKLELPQKVVNVAFDFTVNLLKVKLAKWL